MLCTEYQIVVIELTRIETPNKYWCLEPNQDPSIHGTYIVYREQTSKCNNEKAIFGFNDYRGKLYLASTNQDVCTAKVQSGYYLQIRNDCPASPSKSERITRTYRKLDYNQEQNL